MIGLEQITALVLGNMPGEVLPAFGIELARAVPIEPVVFLLTAQKYPAQHQFADPVRMGLGIGKAERRTPGPAEHHPFLMPCHFAKGLDVGDEMPGGIGLEARERGRAPAAALVEQQYVVERGIELLALRGTVPAAGAAMKENSRLAAGRAAALPIDAVAVANVEHA